MGAVEDQAERDVTSTPSPDVNVAVAVNGTLTPSAGVAPETTTVATSDGAPGGSPAHPAHITPINVHENTTSREHEITDTLT
jgi:hypothetical protein